MSGWPNAPGAIEALDQTRRGLFRFGGPRAAAGGAVLPSPTVVNLISPRRGLPVLPMDAVDRLTSQGWTVIERPLAPGSTSAELPAHVGPEACAVLASWGTPAFSPEVHAALPRLGFIGYCAGSVKRLVGPETFRRGVVVCSGAPIIARAVGEYCLAAALWSLRDLDGLSGALSGREGPARWDRPPRARSLYGRSVGIVAASSTARCFLELLRPFGCSVAVFDPYLSAAEAERLGVGLASLDEVCGQDVVSVHAPDLPATRGLIGAAQLRRIPDGGLFLNSSRAGVVQQDALLAELRTGRIRAVLDVFPQEPLPPDSPLVGLPGVLLTPHAAGFSLDLYAEMGREIVGDLLRWHAGQPPRHAVDARRWELLA